jgi:hypothetical protein
VYRKFPFIQNIPFNIRFYPKKKRKNKGEKKKRTNGKERKNSLPLVFLKTNLLSFWSKVIELALIVLPGIE